MLRPQALDFSGMVGEEIDSFGARKEVDDGLALSGRVLCCSHHGHDGANNSGRYLWMRRAQKWWVMQVYCRWMNGYRGGNRA